MEDLSSSGGGYGFSSSVASTEEIIYGWGIIGLLGTSSVFIHKRQEKRKSK